MTIPNEAGLIPPVDKDPILTLYVGSRGAAIDLPPTRFKLVFCIDPGECTALGLHPELILMDPFGTAAAMDRPLAREWADLLRACEFRSSPPIFILVPQDADQGVRLDLMADGADQVIAWPASVREVLSLSRVYRERSRLCQRLAAKTASLEKSFAYLDRFKVELKKNKIDLFNEKNSLNAALKQVQQMTGERQRLKRQVLDLKTESGLNMEGFSQVLHTLIRHRVEENRGHGERVAKIAGFIAKEMGVGEKILEDLKKAAMLHEVGLLFLSGKPGEAGSKGVSQESGTEPSGYDQALLLQFPVKGAQLLNQCPGFQGPAGIIHSLNENADGTGYPEGLKRRSIPLASRILAGADALDTLRDSGDVQGGQALLSALEPLAGSRLDPVIVGWLEKYVVLHMDSDSFRVRGVGVEQLTPGMELGTALFTTTGTKLFSANTVLTRESINKIIQYHREYPVDDTVYIKA